jgi:hypothetical protein
MMKRFFYMLVCLLMAATTGLFTSCSGEEEEEVIDDQTIAQYTKDIVGTWLMDGTQEYWRFDAQGSGSIGYGENWDQAEDVNEGEGNNFEWYFKSNGLMVIYAVGGDYNDPEPDAPYSIKSITSTKMTWVTSAGYTQTLTRKK